MKNAIIFSFIIIVFLYNISYAQQSGTDVEEVGTIFKLGMGLNIFLLILPLFVMFLVESLKKSGDMANFSWPGTVMIGFRFATPLNVIVLAVLSFACNSMLHDTQAMIFAVAALISRIVLFFVIINLYDNNMRYYDPRLKYLEFGMYTFIAFFYGCNILFLLQQL